MVPYCNSTRRDWGTKNRGRPQAQVCGCASSCSHPPLVIYGAIWTEVETYSMPVRPCVTIKDWLVSVSSTIFWSLLHNHMDRWRPLPWGRSDNSKVMCVLQIHASSFVCFRFLPTETHVDRLSNYGNGAGHVLFSGSFEVIQVSDRKNFLKDGFSIWTVGKRRYREFVIVPRHSRLPSLVTTFWKDNNLLGHSVRSSPRRSVL